MVLGEEKGYFSSTNTTTNILSVESLEIHLTSLESSNAATRGLNGGSDGEVTGVQGLLDKELPLGSLVVCSSKILLTGLFVYLSLFSV